MEQEVNRFSSEALNSHIKVRVYAPPTESRKALCGEKFKSFEKGPSGAEKKYKGWRYCDIPFHQAKEKFDTFKNRYEFSEPFIPGPDGSMQALGHSQGVVLQQPQAQPIPVYACDFPGCGYTTNNQAALHGHKGAAHRGQDPIKAKEALEAALAADNDPDKDEETE